MDRANRSSGEGPSDKRRLTRDKRLLTGTCWPAPPVWGEQVLVSGRFFSISRLSAATSPSPGEREIGALGLPVRIPLGE